MLIRVGYSYTYWQEGIKRPFYWDTDIIPAALLLGHTGQGKTVLAQIIVSQILSEHSDFVEIFILNYKGLDWDQILDEDHYAEFSDISRVWKIFYSKFEDAIERRKKDKDTFLVFEEINSYCLSLESKEYKEFISQISRVALMGRAYGFHFFLIAQQLSSSQFPTYLREQMELVLFAGQITQEEKMMIFTSSDIVDPSACLPRFTGYIRLPVKGTDILQIPYVSDPDRLKMLLIYKANKNGHNQNKADQ